MKLPIYIGSVVNAAALVLLPLPAFAHTDLGGAQTFVAGLLHPLGGVDHLLAAVAIGLWAMLSGARRPLLLPLCFMAVMALAAVAGAAAPGLAMIEGAIATTILGLGLLLAFAVRAPGFAALAIVAAFAIVHGYSHGAEGGAALPYLLGLLVATGVLHLVGIGAGALSLSAGRQELARAAGTGIALVGAWLLIAG